MAENLSPKQKEEFLATSRDRFNLTVEAESSLRKAGQEDDRFRAGEHWPDLVKRRREADARPCLTIDKLSQPIRQVTNQERQARPAIQINPVGGGADRASAEIRQGLIRQIEQRSFADVAYDWAFDGAVSRGWGYFRVLTEYESDDSFDQVIKIDWIENPYTVFFDPSARQWNRSDAMWAHIIEDLTSEAYDARYGKRDGVTRSAGLQQFNALGAQAPTWFPDGGVRLAEYFYVDIVEEELVELVNGQTMLATVLPKKLPRGITVRNRRPVRRRKIKWCLHNALEILESREWAGKYIPIVEVEGERINVDGKRIKRGLIRQAQDSQRMYDYWVSTATETTALAPRAPYIMYEGQDENYEQMWANANTQAFSSLKVRGVTKATGNVLLPLPQRIVAEPPIQAMMAGVKQAELDIHSVTAFYDASDPRRPNAEQSGKAVLARQMQGQQTNMNFVDNFGRSLRYLGEMLLDLLPKIYDRPGRVVEVLGLEDDVREIIINQPFQQGPDGKPQPIQEGEEFVKGLHEFYNLNEGQYDATVTVGASYTTRRQEAVASMLQLVEANPAMAPMIGDVLVENMDWPGAPKLASRLKKMLPPQLQDEQQGPSVEQLQQQLQMVGQQAEQMGQVIQQQKQALDADEVTAQSRERIAAADRESKERIAAIQAQTQLLITQEKLANEQRLALFDSELQRLGRMVDVSQQHDDLAFQAQQAQNAAQQALLESPEPAE